MSSSRTEILDPGGASIRRWWVGHQWADLLLAVAAAMLTFFLARCLGLNSLDAAGRRATYQTVAGLSGTLLGLTMTTVSVLASNIDKGIGGSPKGLPKSLVVGISRPMFGLIRTLGLLLFVTLVLLVGDTTTTHGAGWSQPVLTGLSALVIARLSRVLMLLSNLLKARINP